MDEVAESVHETEREDGRVEQQKLQVCKVFKSSDLAQRVDVI